MKDNGIEKQNYTKICENKDTFTQTNKKKKNLLQNIMIIVCIIVILYSGYNVVNWIIENGSSKSLVSDIHSDVSITHEAVTVDDKILEKATYNFTELLKKNPNTVGWISVPNTKIDYPIVQAPDNDYYLNHSFNNSSNSAGWIFADCACDVQNSQNVIIYGHNRKDRSMFGSLKLATDDEWLSNPDNFYITYSDLNNSGIYKIFSVFIANDKDVSSYLQCDFSSDEDFNEYINKIKKRSNYNFETDIENAKKIITLYTCHGLNNQRLLVFAAKVD